MNKEEALIEFLKGLRVAINNSLAYSRQHPYFMKSAQEFKEKTEGLFNFLNPIKVNVSPEALFSEGKEIKKVAFSAELAKILHQRKVKSIEFRSGLTVNETADFLAILSMQPKEILKKGGLSYLLSGSGIRSISAEDLDYSGLLGTQGVEAKNIWLYLFKDTVENNDALKINELANNFSKSINNLSVKQVIDDDKLRENLRNFLRYLKETNNENFSRCSHELASLIVTSGVKFSAEEINKLKEVFNDLDNNDFSDIFLSQLSSDSNLSSLSLGLFSRLAGEDRAGNIASGLADKFGAKGGLQNKTALAKKIKDLLSDPDTTNISSVYRVALSALVKNISPEGKISFDRGSWRENYRMILLNFFLQENNPGELNLILGRLNNELESIAQEKDYNFLKHLLSVLKQKKADLPPDLFEGIEKEITRIVEDNIWRLDNSECLGELVDSLERVYPEADFYLNKIFQEKIVSRYGLKLFLKFFPSQVNIFCDRLKETRSDLEFLSQMIKAIGEIDLPVSLVVLKEIFLFGNELVRLEALKAMRQSSEFDPGFVFPLLKEKSRILRKAALEILLREGASKQKALDELLGVRSLWGMNNQLMLDNIMIIEELNIREAVGYLIYFSKKGFFWNRKLKVKALTLLKEWG